VTLAVVILAAGKSTRFKSATPKVLHEFGERPMIESSLNLAAQISDVPPVLVVGAETEVPLREWAGDRARFVFQAERLGTGHAVLQTRPLLEGTADRVLVLYGDMPLLQLSTLQQLIALQEKDDAAMAMVTIIRDESQGFGRVLRNADGNVVQVVEEPEATPEQLKIRELNAGLYVYDAEFLWTYLPKVSPSAKKGEIYLTDMAELAASAGLKALPLVLEDPTEAMGINTRLNFASAQAVLRRRINEACMLAGATLVDPATTYIGPNVALGRDTMVLPNTHLRGTTRIGEGCEIGPNTIIADSVIGDRCRVTASVIESSEMEHDSDIGPFSHLRPGACVCTGAHIGNFAEMKESTLGPGSHMGHFSYLGDATIGEHVNIGAGTITCNYDGKQKHQTVIEGHAFVGSDSLLIAPVHIGEHAKTGAGSVVTHDVPARTIVYGVPARPHGTVEEEPSPDVSADTSGDEKH
jgi:bifunctional UDP-N-acetylglucosamine pyrophosphorylase / glucosamine-1-phosphate N-acetyltransferase